VKDTACMKSSHATQELKDNIKRKIYAISRQGLACEI
jgi:hypothetical protein